MSSLGLHFISHPPPLVHHQNISAQVMIIYSKDLMIMEAFLSGEGGRIYLI